jgi:hypothetical protein
LKGETLEEDGNASQWSSLTLSQLTRNSQISDAVDCARVLFAVHKLEDGQGSLVAGDRALELPEPHQQLSETQQRGGVQRMLIANQAARALDSLLEIMLSEPTQGRRVLRGKKSKKRPRWEKTAKRPR